MRETVDSRDRELQMLVSDIERIRASALDSRGLVDGVAAAMAAFTRGGTTLPERFCTQWSERYAQHVIHVSADREFSLVALVWRPGQGTSIHDHRGWCVVSVSDGCERETRYRAEPAAAYGKLEIAEVRDTGPGESVALLPDGSDVHRVVNNSRATTISLHAYGVDIERYGTSVNRNFGNLATSAAG